MSVTPPFNFQKWIEENREALKPPVGNKEVYASGDFIVQVIGGPNRRNDFHIDPGDELFYQVHGEVEVIYLDEDGRRQVAHLRAGDMWLCPAWVPHSPQRGPHTVGLVVERQRLETEQDRFAWFCDACNSLIHEVSLRVTDIVGQLKVIMEEFYASEAMRTCKKCGAVLPAPKPRGVPSS